MVSSSQTAIQRDLLRIRWKEEAFRGSISDMVTPLVELPSVLCDVVEILEGAVRVVSGQGGQCQWLEDREEEGEVSGPQVMRGTLHCAVTNIAADGIMSTDDTITSMIASHTTPQDSRYHVPKQSVPWAHARAPFSSAGPGSFT